MRIAAVLTASILLAVMLLGCGAAPVAEPSAALPVRGQALTGEQPVTVADNGRLRLTVVPKDGSFTVEDRESALVLHSVPEDIDEDTMAVGYQRTTIGAAFEVTTINERRVTDTTNSTVASVNKGGLTVHATQNGAILTYDMPDLGVTVPLCITIADDVFFVSVLAAEIREYGKNKLLSVTVMPYLGCAGVQDEGYLVVPDGSGALLRFSPGTDAPDPIVYKKAVYGDDPMDPLTGVTSRTQEILLPVFGIRAGKRSLLGIVTEGDALAQIQMYAKGTRTLHAGLHTVMRYRGVSSRTLFDTEWNRKKITIVSDEPIAQPVYTVRYALLRDAGYNEMAAAAAAYYAAAAENGTQQRRARIPITVTGAVREQTAVLGIPVRRVAAIDTFADMAALADAVAETGIGGFDLQIDGMFSGGVLDRYPSDAKLERVLGGSDALDALDDALRQHGALLLPLADLSRIYRSGSGVSAQWDAARDHTGGTRTLTSFSRVTGYEDTADPLTCTLLRPDLLGKQYRRMAEGLRRLGIDGFADAGASVLYSHSPHGGDAVDRQQALLLQTQAVRELSATLQAYTAQGAGAYLLPYLSQITEVPAASSRIDGFSEEIPFYSLVVSRFVGLSADAINDSGDRTAYLLRCLEYGLLPSAYLTAGDPAAVSGTRANFRFAADRDTVLSLLREMSKGYGEALALVRQQPIAAHEKIGAHVYRSTYADGSRIVVNYGDAPATADGVNVPARGYRLIRKGAEG